MAEKKKSTVEKVTGAVQGAAAAVVKAADEHVVKPVGKALGLTGEAKAAGGEQTVAKPTGGQPAVTTPAPVEPAPKPVAAKKSAAAKVMTQSVAGKKTGAAKTMSKRVADAKPTKKPMTGGGSKGPRRGASKGR